MTTQESTQNQRSDWQYIHLYPLTGGYNVSESPDAIPNEDATEALNVRYEKQRVVGDYGYAAVGQAVRGTPQMVYQFNKRDNEVEILLLTTNSLYVWSQGQWMYVRDGDIGTTCTSDQGEGTTNIVVSSSSGFSSGDYIGVILDDLSEHQTTVDSIPDSTHITIADAIPSGRSIESGARLVKAVDLEGTLKIIPSMDTWPADDWVIITNGADHVKRYDGADCRDLDGLVAAGITKARIVRAYNNHVVLFHTEEGGTTYPNRVRRSDTGNPTNWTTGNAGYNDLFDIGQEIVAAEPLGPYIIIYREDAITRMEYAGSASRLFLFIPTVTDEGAMSANAVINEGNFHAVMGSSTFYLYDGGYAIKSFKGNIRNELYLKSIVDMHRRYMIRSDYIDTLREFWWMVPIEGGGMRTYRFKVDTGGWSYRTFADPMSSVARVLHRRNLSWSEATGTWSDPKWSITWGDLSISKEFTRVLLCSATGNMVYEYADYADTDGGNSFMRRWATKDIISVGRKIRVDYVKAKYMGGPLTVEYSTDAGDTYESYGTLEDTGGMGEEDIRVGTVYRQVVGDRVRFRFSATSPFALEWIEIRYREESIW